MDFLDTEDGAGWRLLESMILCRRRKDGSAAAQAKPLSGLPSP